MSQRLDQAEPWVPAVLVGPEQQDYKLSARGRHIDLPNGKCMACVFRFSSSSWWFISSLIFVHNAIFVIVHSGFPAGCRASWKSRQRLALGRRGSLGQMGRSEMMCLLCLSSCWVWTSQLRPSTRTSWSRTSSHRHAHPLHPLHHRISGPICCASSCKP